MFEHTKDRRAAEKELREFLVSFGLYAAPEEIAGFDKAFEGEYNKKKVS